jgi:hypothetical protein
MSNPWRGEVALMLDGVSYDLRLTLGALADLETALKASSLMDVVRRFDSGQYSTRDVLAVLQAGLKGGGARPMRDLAEAEIDGGITRAAQVAAQLLVRAFALPEESA